MKSPFSVFRIFESVGQDDISFSKIFLKEIPAFVGTPLVFKQAEFRDVIPSELFKALAEFYEFRLELTHRNFRYSVLINLEDPNELSTHRYRHALLRGEAGSVCFPP